jgi:hypothetical protein
MQIQDTATQEFESGLQKTFAAFMKGEESSFTDAMRNMAKGIWDAVADTVSNQLTEMVMGAFGFKTADQKIKEGMIEAAEEHARLIRGVMYDAAVAKSTQDENAQLATDAILHQRDAEFFTAGYDPEKVAAQNAIDDTGNTAVNDVAQQIADALGLSRDDIVIAGQGEVDRSGELAVQPVVDSATRQELASVVTELQKFNDDTDKPVVDSVARQTLSSIVQQLKQNAMATEFDDESFKKWLEGGGTIKPNTLPDALPTEFDDESFKKWLEKDSTITPIGPPTGVSGLNNQFKPEWNGLQNLGVDMGISSGDNAALASNADTFFKKGITSGSIFTHDTHVVAAIQELGTKLGTGSGGDGAPKVPGPEGEPKFTEKQTADFKEKFGGVFPNPLMTGKKAPGSVDADGNPVGAPLKGGGFMSKLTGFFSADAPWMNKLGDFFSGDSEFLSGLSGMFGGLGDMLGGLMGGAGGGGWMSLITMAMSFFADGGIAKGGFRKFARGGIATSPTLGLIGEGRHNEAVVPLPNGKAIPVDMRSNSQNNNVTVNVSSDGQTQTSGADSEGLGNAIAKAVQEELQNQKRAGGILSKYGTA